MIDMRTAFFFLGFASVVFALLLSLTTKKSGSKRVISWLAWARLAQGMAFFLLSGRGTIPELLSKNIGNALLFSGLSLECIAAWIFVGRSRWKEVVVPVWVVSVVGMNTGTMVESPDAIKVAVASFIVALLMILCAVAFLRGGSNRSRLALTIGVLDAVVALVNIARGATALLSPDFTLLSPAMVQYLAVDALLLFIFSNGFGFLLLIKEEDDRQLKESEERYRVIFASGNAMKLAIDPETGQILDANAAAAAFYGYDQDSIRGLSVRDANLLAWEDFLNNVAMASREEQPPFLFQHHLPGGKVRDVEVYASPFEWREKRLVVCTIHDVTERKQAETALRAALHEKEVLLREIHHRVKNNMQVVSSLLTMQAEKVEHEPVQQALLESQQRIVAMAMIHEALYSGQDLAIIDLSAYLKELVHHLEGVYGSQVDVRVALDLDKVELGIDQAVPCGLIINELITNAFKHAFPDGSAGTIQIKVHQVDKEEAVLEVRDNGVGLTPNLDLANPSSLGLRLVQGLLKHQLKGSLDLAREGGTAFTIRWPLPDGKASSV